MPLRIIMIEGVGFTVVFEATFEALYAYVYRRIDDKEFIGDILKQIYARLEDVEGVEDMDSERIRLLGYRMAYNFLKENSLFAANEDFWSSLTIEEAEILRLRFLEGLSSFEIAIVLHEQAGRLDAFLYATLMKAQELFPKLSKKRFVGAYFSELNACFKEMKDAENINIPQDFRVKLFQDLFNAIYNASRDMNLPEKPEEVDKNLKVADFFNKPMQKEEQKQFSVQIEALEKRNPEWALRKEEQWVPEDKESALPEDNKMGYGMDLLKTFKKAPEVQPEVTSEFSEEETALKAISESVAIRQKINVADSENLQEKVQHTYELPTESVETDTAPEKSKFRKWRKGFISPLVALAIVLLGTIYFPFQNDVDKFSEDYNVLYTDVFLAENTFEQKKNIINEVLKEILTERSAEFVSVDYPKNRNMEVVIDLKSGKRERFVFYKMLRDGKEKWVPRKYELID